MEKVVCESCGREIPEKAKICPYCHQKNVARTGGAKSVLKKIWDAVVMLVGIAIIIYGVSHYISLTFLPTLRAVSLLNAQLRATSSVRFVTSSWLKELL